MLKIWVRGDGTRPGLESLPVSPNMVVWLTGPGPIEDEQTMETIGADLRQMQRVPLAASHVQALLAAGKIATYPAGTFLARPGEPADRFVYVEEGEIEVVNPYTNERHLPSTLGPTQFMGEISFLSGGAWSMLMRAVRDTRVTEAPREAMLALMS